MTHEELLSRIDERDLSFSHPDSVFSFDDWPNRALRSIVNLHSPEGKPTSQCRNCRSFYPCHTVKAIIKELQ